ncbi:pilus assembly protein CpaE [Stella humosa]|uniref:Pilus assembly protein CpaE n=1 Tax=Stella humosa TaxID=94 RepID=A0A3N1MEN6_9PROT|nr:hypothetical protein [Stella humosa]ROQ01157.1 pilus assembly protein CpaE [Stella humosa]BBK31532.1 pilus assembly protein CpaE [Stella humosa]
MRRDTARADAGGDQRTPAPARPLVIAYITDAESADVLRLAMEGLGDGLTVERGGIRKAIKDMAHEATPQVLIVDVSDADDPLVALNDLANVCERDVRVLVVGESRDVSFYRDIVRGLGVLEYLSKPLTRNNVGRYFLPIVQGRSPAAGEDIGGRIITVCGARGGVGATTIAANLAIQLVEQTRGYVSLIDMHLQSGAAAIMMGLKASAGLRIALEEPDRVDALFIDRTSVPVSDRLRLIAAEEPFESTPRPTTEGVTRLMAELRRRSNYVVVDMPTPADPAIRAIYGLAHTRLVVMNPEIVSIRDAGRLRVMLAAMPDTNPPLLVLNRAGSRHAIPTNLVNNALPAKVDFEIPDIPNDMIVAANLGIPAVKRSRAFRASMLGLAGEISGVRVDKARTGWFRRAISR